MALKDKKYIAELKIEMENIAPLHLGSEDNEILIDEENNKVCIPGTSIAGAFRAYLSSIINSNKVNEMFGEGSNMSNIFIYDTFSHLSGMEIRPGVKINKEYGVAENGGKFDRAFISANHKFILEVEVFSTDIEAHEEYKKAIYSCIKGLNDGNITLGAYKSLGAGLFRVIKVSERNSSLENAKELFGYLKDTSKFNEISLNSILEKSFDSNDVTFTLEGTLRTPLLIKDDDPLDCDDVDGIGIKNKQGNYIIPGSSLKGVIRGQAEKILEYRNYKNISSLIFGGEDNNDEKIASSFRAFDTIITDAKDGEYNKIKIDKFTGGVMKGALMNDKPVIGNVKLEGKYKYKEDEEIPKVAVAVLALVFRDLAIGDLSLGSGYGIGRGRINGSYLKISKGKDTLYEYDFTNNKLLVDNLNPYFEVLNEGGK